MIRLAYPLEFTVSSLRSERFFALTTTALIVAGLCLGLAITTQSHAEGGIQLPEIGDSSARVLSGSQSNKIGRRAYYQLREYNFILEDPESSYYLQALGERIAAGTNRPLGSFTFFIVNDPRINAFAMPGGYIGMNLGLMTAAETESELGGVLAHEITHVTQQHIARILEATKPYDLATGALVLAAILLGGGDGEIATAAISAGLASSIERQINFTRAHEHEADRLGIQLLATANLDVNGMAAFFERLDQQSRYYSSSNFPDFLRTHPVTTTRIAEARSRATNYNQGDIKSSRSFALIRNRLRVLGADPASNPLLGNPHKDADIASRYGHALALQRNGQQKQAMKVFAKLLSEDESTLLFHLGLAQSALEIKEMEAALAAYEKAARLFPNHPVLQLRQGEALLVAGKPHEGRTMLQRATRQQPDYPPLHKLLARSAAELSRPIDAHLHLVDYHFFSGRQTEAEDQIDIALKFDGLTDGDRERIKVKRDQIRGKDPKNK